MDNTDLNGKFTKTSIRRGQYVELIENANYIPAGVYKVSMASAGELHFELGRGIYFGFSTNAGANIKPLPKMEGIKRCTSSGEFVRRYYDLIESKPSSDTKIRSFCSISIEVMNTFRPEATYYIQ